MRAKSILYETFVASLLALGQKTSAWCWAWLFLNGMGKSTMG